MVPALIKRFVEAADNSTMSTSVTESPSDWTKVTPQSSVTVWGTGTPRREIMHVDDFAAAALHLVDRSATGLINVGTGNDLSVEAIARRIALEAGFNGDIVFDDSKPDGMPRKVMDIKRLRDYGWGALPATGQRLKETVAWYRENRK